MPDALNRTFAAPYQTVFDATLRVLPSLKMSVQFSDPSQGLISASASMSALSWGENVTIRLGGTDNTATTVSVESTAKVLWAAGKNQKNINNIFDAIGRALAQMPPG